MATGIAGGATGVEWRVSDGLVPYPAALAEMEARVEAVRGGEANELVWLLEHPPLYTAGTSARPHDLIAPGRFPVYPAGRGGQYTYHGPGQRVGYLVLDLAARGRDVRHFIETLEAWLIGALGRLGVPARTADGRVGIWTDDRAGREAKIGAIGVRVRRWVAFHGFALNVAPDLEHFSGIVPCGLPEFPVTSLADLGIGDGAVATMKQFDDALAAGLETFLADLSAGPRMALHAADGGQRRATGHPERGAPILS